MEKLQKISVMLHIREMLKIKNALILGGLKLGIISNTNELSANVCEKCYPVVLEGYEYKAYSHVLGLRKPDHKIYTHTLARLNVTAGECLFVDDRLENIEAFRNLGGFGWHFDVSSPGALWADDQRVADARRKLEIVLVGLGLISSSIQK